MLFLLDANAYKVRVEAAVSQAWRMQIKVAGTMGITFSPGLLITLADVQVRNRGNDVASAKQAKLGIQIVPLLVGEVRITSLALSHAIAGGPSRLARAGLAQRVPVRRHARLRGQTNGAPHRSG